MNKDVYMYISFNRKNSSIVSVEFVQEFTRRTAWLRTVPVSPGHVPRSSFTWDANTCITLFTSSCRTVSSQWSQCLPWCCSRVDRNVSPSVRFDEFQPTKITLFAVILLMTN